VLPIRLLNVTDVKHLAMGEVRLHEYGKLMDVMLQHVDVVAMGPSDSVNLFWSAQASATVFDLVRYSDGISSRMKKRLESLSWITLYKMMVEINKYEEKLMLLEMVVADGGMMVYLLLVFLATLVFNFTLGSFLVFWFYFTLGRFWFFGF
jgi:hypothetical protein